jgi:ketosteroid isomerase-like protein
MNALILSLALAAACLPMGATPPHPFDGIWKLNLAKSHVTGDTFTYSKTPAGLMHLSGAGPLEYEFGLDGKPYPTASHYTVTWTPSGVSEWQMDWRLGDKVTTRSRVFISTDDEALTFDSTDFLPDGTQTHELDLYHRVSGGPGLPGTWKSVKVQQVTDTFSVSTPGPGRIRFTNPAYQWTFEGALDGTFAPLEGPTLSPGHEMALTAPAPGTRQWTFRFENTILAKGEWKLSADGKTMTQTSWVPGKEGEKSTWVYEKERVLHGEADPARVHELTRVEEAWNAAMVRSDPSALKALLAEEYTSTDFLGVLRNREQDLADLKSGAYKTESATLTELKVRAYGEVAVVTGVNTLKGTENGKPLDGRHRFTDVFVKRDGRWQCVATQGTRIAKP